MSDIIPRLRGFRQSSDRARMAADFLLYARCFAAAQGDRTGAARMLMLQAPHRQDLVEAAQRNAVAAGNTTDSTWAAPLSALDTLAAAFLESLSSDSIVDFLFANGGAVRVPLSMKIDSITAAATAHVVGESQARALSSMALSATAVSPITAIAIVAMTEQLITFALAGSGDLFAAELSTAVARASDGEALRVLAAAAVTASTTHASSGNNVANVITDLTTVLTDIAPRARSRLTLVVEPAVCVGLSLLRDTNGPQSFPGVSVDGGSISGIAVRPNDQIASGTAILVDGSRLVGNPGTVELATAKNATIQMDSSPDSPPLSSTSVVSLFQSGLRAIRARRDFGLAPAGQGHPVAQLTSVSWGS